MYGFFSLVLSIIYNDVFFLGDYTSAHFEIKFYA